MVAAFSGVVVLVRGADVQPYIYIFPPHMQKRPDYCRCVNQKT